MKEEIKKIYDYKLSNLNKVKDEAYFIIDSFLEKSDIKIHSIQSRIKRIDSLIKKAENQEISNPKNVFEEINDIVGLRVICLFISDITGIVNLVKDNFTIVEEDNKLSGSDISSFGYFSVHFVCKLKDEYKGPRYDSIKELNFEIQVRTISMDAWANISHYLDYKSEMEVPKELKKDFFALSGLFYVADTHFEMFFKNKKEQSQIAQKDVEQNIDAEINFETIEAYINAKFEKRKAADSNSISRVTRELLDNGYETISDVNKKILEGLKIKSEKSRRQTFNRVGILRDILDDADANYYKARRKHLSK